MRSVLLVMSLSLACGCEQPQVIEGTQYEVDMTDARDVRLPTAIAAKAHGFNDDRVIFLNVNRVGQLALAPADIQGGSAGLLNTRDEVLAFLRQRVQADREAASLPDPTVPRTVILRIDSLTRFQHTHAILTAAREAGYARFRIRAYQPEALTEGEFELGCPAEDRGARPLRCAVRVAADDAGSITKLTFCGDSLADRVEHGLDLVALLHTLQATAHVAEDNHRPANLAIEADPRLRHAHLVQVIDIGTRAGFRGVWPTLLNGRQ